jgi:hypothetical protein
MTKAMNAGIAARRLKPATMCLRFDMQRRKLPRNMDHGAS